MLGASDFGSSFQRVLVRAVIDDPGLRALVTKFADAGALGFTDPAARWAWELIRATEYPTMLQLETESQRLSPADPARAGVAGIVGLRDHREDDYVRGRVVDWARRSVFAAGYEESRVAWNAGDVDGAYRIMMARMEQHQAIRLESADRGWFFEEFDGRQERRQIAAAGLDYFPIGIDRIDRAMNGGLHFGELEVPLAYSGIGKTFYCVQRGFAAARMRRRVLHFVLEGGRSKTEDRYEARFSESLYSAVRVGSFDSHVAMILRREYDAMRHCLIVRGFADKETVWRITIDDIIAELSDLRRSFGWVPELIVVDYGDLVHAEGKDEKERQRNGFRQLHALSERTDAYRGHRGYAVSAPSQAVRPGEGDDTREHILKARDVADSYDKVRIADAIVSLNRTEDEKKAQRARVALVKYRDDEDGIVVKVRTDYPRGTFCVIGEEIAGEGSAPVGGEVVY